MERLTVKRPDGRWAIASSDNASPTERVMKIPAVIDRLAAYEDTGLETEEIVGLKNCYEQLNASFDQIFRANDAMGKELDAYKRTGMEPCDYSAMSHALQKAKKAEGDLNELICIVGGVGFSRIKELAQAEQEGRLVVLPCKVGDYVYIPSIERQEAIRVRVQGISVSVSGRTILRFGGYPAESAWGDGCGKDWFLTREEAEKALRGGTHE